MVDHSHESGVPPPISRLFTQPTRKLTRDTLSYLPAMVVPAALSIVTASVFTRMFAPEEYGRYALVLAAATVASTVLSGWLQQSALRYLPRYKAAGELTDFVVKLVVMSLGVATPVVLVLVGGHSLIARHLGSYGRFLVPAVLLVVSELFFLNLGVVLQADLRSKAYSWFRVSNAALRFGLALAFVLLVDRDVVGLIAGAAAANLLVVLPMLAELRVLGKLPNAHKFIDLDLVKLFAAYGLPMLGWLLCGQILAISDRFVLGALRGSAEVGVYAANYNLVRMGFDLISGPILTASYPLIMTAWETGQRDRVWQVISDFTRHYFLAVAPFATFIAVLGREIVSVVLGPEFHEGHTIIPFLIAGFVFWGVAMIGHKGLEIAEKTGTLLLLVIVCAVLNIALNFAFIPAFGYNGAAVAAFLSYLAYPVLVYWATRRFIPWRIPWRSVLRIAAACAVMAGILVVVSRLMPQSTPRLLVLSLAAAAGTPVYIALLVWTGELRSSDLRFRLDDLRKRW
jgi:O-antigen/teichoic acid export membrane protein